MSDKSLPSDQNTYLQPGRLTWVIFWISVLGLFLEMLFIRWIGTEIRIFAYLQNTILVACFLGIGLGCFTCRKPINLRQSLVPLLILVSLLAIPLTRTALGRASELLSVLGDLVIWGRVSAENPTHAIGFVLIGLIITFLLVLLVVDIFVPIGRVLGRAMDDHPKTIWAYSVNLVGSLLGTWLFVLMSFFNLPPITWFIVFGLLMMIFITWDKNRRWVSLALMLAVVLVSGISAIEPYAQEVIWSPYQKLVTLPMDSIKGQNGELVIMVNNTGYQAMKNLSPENVQANPDVFSPEMAGFSQYDLPPLFHPNPHSMLIVGAGSGNDAAGGLRNGVQEVTAVDIDPAIIDIGRRLHPERPYSSPNVIVVNDDARSFFATTEKTYDVIAFGLLDSHTTTSMTNARLDHYVYTRESIERAKALLNDNGVMVLTFAVQTPFIGDRMYAVLTEVFGEAPIAFQIPFSAYGWGGTMFVAGDLQTVRSQIDANPRLDAFITQLQQETPLPFNGTTKVATDDWPYIYLEAPQVPVLYFLLAILMILVFVLSAWRWKAGNVVTHWNTSHWHFFFLGAGFLLLEVQNISKAAVVLGNTWQVNAVIISGVLSMALLANILTHRFPRIPLAFAYAGLIGIGIALYFVDLAAFSFLPYVTKALIVGSLTTLPMLFSGIIFIRSFARSENKNEALGANMIGSLVGALLQSVTFVIGIKALLLVVVVIYFLSLLTLPRQGQEVKQLLWTQKEAGPAS